MTKAAPKAIEGQAQNIASAKNSEQAEK